MKRYQKLLSVILAIMMVVSLLPTNLVFAADTAIEFTNGVFADDLSNGDKTFASSEVSFLDGYAQGIGYVVYKLDPNETIKGFKINYDTLGDAWNYAPAEEGRPGVFAATYDGATLVKGDEIETLQIFRSSEVVDSVKPKWQYLSADPVPAGTEYLWIELPDANWFQGEWSYDRFVLTNVEIHNADSTEEFYDYTIDIADALQDNYDENIRVDDGDASRFGRPGGIVAGNGNMTYTDPENGIARVLVQSVYGSSLPGEVDWTQVWYSTDGTSYTQAVLTADSATAMTGNSDHVPATYTVDLPDGVTNVQVRPGNWSRILTVAYAVGEGSSEPVTPPVDPDEPVEPGVVPFDASGVYVEDFSDNDNMAWYTDNLAGITAAPVNGAEDAAIVYNAGEGKAFSSVTVKAHFGMQVYTNELNGNSEIRAFTAVPDGDGGFTDGTEIPMVRKMDTDQFTPDSDFYVDWVSASPLPGDTQYVRVYLFPRGFYWWPEDGMSDKAYVDAIELTSADTSEPVYSYTQDRLSDTSLAYSVGSNLTIGDINGGTWGDEYRKALDNVGLTKVDLSTADNTDLIYYDADGIDRISLQVATTEALANGAIALATSADNSTYTPVEDATWIIESVADWEPETTRLAVLSADSLPEGTKYVKITQTTSERAFHLTHVVYGKLGGQGTDPAPVNFAVLNTALSAYAELNKEDYTSDSWTASNIEALVAAGEALLTNPDATQLQINEAAQAITAAIGLLEEDISAGTIGVVPFDASGVYVEDFSDNDSMAWYTDNLEGVSGPVSGIGNVSIVYNAGEGKSFSSLTLSAALRTVDAHGNGFNDLREVRVYAVTPDGAGGYTEGEEIPVVRMIDNMNLTDSDGCDWSLNIRYVTASKIPDGTQYIKVTFAPTNAFWNSNTGAMVTNSITLTSNRYVGIIYNYTQNTLENMDAVYEAGSNLSMGQITDTNWGSQQRGAMDTNAVVKTDVNGTDNDIVFSSEVSMANFYLQAALSGDNPTPAFMLYASSDGATYTLVEDVEYAYGKRVGWANGDHRPAFIRSDSLPEGTRYVKVSQAANSKQVYLTHVVYGEKDEFSSLNEALTVYEGLDKELYFEDSWNDSGIDAAAAAGRELLADPNLTAEQAKEAANAIYAAIDKLELIPPPDFSTLYTALGAYGVLTKSDYTEESWNNSNIDAIAAEAEALIGKDTTKQADIDAMVIALNEAIASLELIPPPELVEPTGNSVSFVKGIFTDPLDNIDSLAVLSGPYHENGSLKGNGYAVYDLSDTTLKGLTIDVSYNIWSTNFDEASEVKAYVAISDGNGGFTKGQEIQLARQIDTANMVPSDGKAENVKAIYISGKVPVNTQFVWIELNQTAIAVDGVTLYSVDASKEFYKMIIDRCEDFSLVANADELTNLTVKTIQGADSKWIHSAGTYFERNNATTTQGATMLYQAPIGQQFNTLYIQAFYLFERPEQITVWASNDNVNYFQVPASQTPPPAAVGGGMNNNLVPYIINTTLPAGTKYVQIRYPEFPEGSLYGSLHPRVTSIQLGVGELGAWIDPEASAVTFTDGKFSDNFENELNNTIANEGATASAWNLAGPGYLVYKLGSADQLKGITVDVKYEIWGLTFDPDSDLKAYIATTTDEVTFEKGEELTLVRKLHPQDTESDNWMEATYEYSGTSIPSNAKYVLIELPTTDFFGESQEYGKFQVKTITLHNTQSSHVFRNYTVDDCKDMTAVLNSSKNIQLFRSTEKWFSTNAPVYSMINTEEAAVLTYRAEIGTNLKNIFAQLHLNSGDPLNVEIWAAGNDRVYSKVNADTQVKYYSQWSPMTIAADLPEGTEYVQIRIPAYGHDVAVASVLIDGTLTTVPPPEMNYTVNFLQNPVTFDGVFNADEWSDADAMIIEGTVSGGNKYGGSLYFKYDYDKLYIAAVIDDPTPMVNNQTGGGIWEGDCIEFFYGTEDLDGEDAPMLPTDVQLVLSGSLTHGTQYYLQLNSANQPITIETIAIQKHADGKGYTLETEIPLSTLYLNEPWNGLEMRMNNVINENSSAGRGQFGWTTTGEDNKKKRNLWGDVVFETAPAPDVEIMITNKGTDNVLNADAVTASNEVTVEGVRADGAAGKEVTIKVTDSAGEIAYMKQLTSGADGAFSVTFTIDPSRYADGFFTVTAGGDEINRKDTATFTFDENAISYKPLTDALAAYNALVPDDYTEDSWAASGIETAVADGEAVLGDPAATQEAINAAAQAILTAIDALEEAPVVTPVDTSDLEAAIAQAGTFSEDDYTEDSWAALAAAVTAGEAVLADADATQDDVDAAAAAINDAIAALEEKPSGTLVDTSALNAAIAAAGELEEDDYTEESWAALADALATGAYVLADDNATQDDVDAAAAEILAAIDALEEKPASSEPEKPVKPTKPYVPPTHYVVVVKANEGGTVNPSGILYVAPGADQTITVTPDAGYYVKQVLLDRKEEVQLVNGTFTLKNVTEPYTIDVIFEKIPVGIEVTDPETPPATSNPQTGDSGMNFALLALLIGGIAITVAARKRKEV